MSIAAIAWAFRQKCRTPAEKLVLIALADQANDEGACWPGQEYVADKCGLSREAVCRFIRQLERSGKVESLRRKDDAGRDLGKRYLLKIYPPGVINNHMPCDQQSHRVCSTVTSYKGIGTVIEPSLNQEPARSENFQKSTLLAEHSFTRFKELMPLRNGKFLDEDACREKWARSPAQVNQWIAAVKNYAASEEVAAGRVCGPMKFLTSKWRDWLTPEEKPTGEKWVPDLSWQKERAEDLRKAQERLARKRGKSLDTETADVTDRGG